MRGLVFNKSDLKKLDVYFIQVSLPETPAQARPGTRGRPGDSLPGKRQSGNPGVSTITFDTIALQNKLRSEADAYLFLMIG